MLLILNQWFLWFYSSVRTRCVTCDKFRIYKMIQEQEDTLDNERVYWICWVATTFLIVGRQALIKGFRTILFTAIVWRHTRKETLNFINFGVFIWGPFDKTIVHLNTDSVVNVCCDIIFRTRYYISICIL